MSGPAERQDTSRRAVFLALFAVLVCARMPGILLHGRLWAEEGIFYQNAWTVPPARALLVEYGGYLNLVANLGGLLARYAVPLQNAPWVMTGIGLLFQLCPGVLIVTSRASWLRPPLAMAAALFALGAAPIAEEVWLQTLHSQYHLALGVALTLSFDDRPAPAVRWLRRVVLVLAPLCGLLAVLLLPLLLLRAALERSRERIVQAALLLIGSAIQLGLFYSPAGGTALGRPSGVWPGIIVYLVFLRHGVLPLLGFEAARQAGAAIADALASRPPLWPALPMSLLLGGLAWFSLRRRRSAAPWLLAAALGIAGVSYYGAIDGGVIFLNPRYGQRYSFVPQVLIVWTLICLAASPPYGLVSRSCAVVTTWLLLVSAAMLPAAGATQFAHGPSWRDEARAWAADPRHLLRLWPDGWVMQLDPGHAATAPARFVK